MVLWFQQVDSSLKSDLERGPREVSVLVWQGGDGDVRRLGEAGAVVVNEGVRRRPIVGTPGHSPKADDIPEVVQGDLRSFQDCTSTQIVHATSNEIDSLEVLATPTRVFASGSHTNSHGTQHVKNKRKTLTRLTKSTVEKQ